MQFKRTLEELATDFATLHSKQNGCTDGEASKAFEYLKERVDNFLWKRANAYASRLYGIVDRDELYVAALGALFEAALKFRVKRGTNFLTFAGRIIDGRIKDYLRENDNFCRSFREIDREVSELRYSHYSRTHSYLTNPEVCRMLGLNSLQTRRYLMQSAMSSRQSLSMTVLVDGEPRNFYEILKDPCATDPSLEADTVEGRLRSLAKSYPSRSKGDCYKGYNIFDLYVWHFFDGLPKNQIASMVGVNPSRLSQVMLSPSSLSLMREALSGYCVHDK